MKLTREERDYLFKKIEYSKKKKAIETENKLFTILKGDEDLSNEDISLVLKSLEYGFRKRLIGDKPDLKTEIFLNIKSKIPENFILVKFSNLNKKPSKSSSKKEIISYLKRKKIDFDENDTKAKLFSLVENRLVNYSEFSDMKNKDEKA